MSCGLGKDKNEKGLQSPRRITNNSKTDTEKERGAFSEVVAIRRTAVPRTEVPGATAYNMMSRSVFVHPCPSIDWCPFIVLVPVILAPFPDVAVHIVQPIGICILLDFGQIVM
jgi:hypothetical protein